MNRVPSPGRPFLCRRPFLWTLVAVGAALRIFQYASDTSLWYDELSIVRNLVHRSETRLLMHLARYAEDVQIVVRREGLQETMSRYLIDQIGKTPNVRLLPQTEIAGVEGEGHVERVTLRSLVDGSCRTEEVDAMFVFIGTRPRSDWLPAGVIRDDKGFVLTGRDLMAAEPYRRTWKERREPLPLETSVPGVFAAGDVRAGAMNRVASAVGEGSMVVRLAHEYLALT